MRSIEVEAEDLRGARDKLASQMSNTEIVVAERPIEDGQSRTSTGVGETEGDALAAARGEIPNEARVLKRSTLKAPEHQVMTVDALDEQSARSDVESRLNKTQVLRNLSLHRLGRRGILGIGRTPNVYSADIFQRCVVEVIWASNAKLAARVGSREAADAVDSPTMAKTIKLSDQEQVIRRKHNDDLQSLALKAEELRRAGQLEDAFSYWRILTAAKPERATSWGICGVVLQQMTEAVWLKAIPELARMAPGLEKGEDAWRDGIRRQLPHDNLRLAIAYLNRALEIDRNLEMGWYTKAHCLCQIGITTKDAATVKRGLECFEQALRVKADTRTQNDKAKFEIAFDQMVWG